MSEAVMQDVMAFTRLPHGIPRRKLERPGR